MTTANDTTVFSAARRFNVCCPNAGCTCHADGVRLLAKLGIIPKMGVDEDGHHYLEFSVPVTWSLKKRRRFNERLTRRINSDLEPCDYCGNTMYSEAMDIIPEDGDGQLLWMCDECCEAGIDPYAFDPSGIS